MVIDVHVHPNGYPQVAQDPASRAFRDRVFQRRPQDALSAPIAMTGKPSGGNGGGNKNFDVLFTRMDHEGIDRFVLLPMDSPEVFFRHIFTREWGPTWFEHNFADKVMYGSDSPRNHTHGIEKLEMRPDTRAKLMGGNAIKWLGMEVK